MSTQTVLMELFFILIRDTHFIHLDRIGENYSFRQRRKEGVKNVFFFTVR